MHPVLFAVPSLGITVRSYPVLLALSVLFCLSVGPRWMAALEGLEASAVRRALVVLALLVFAGGRLHFVLANPSLFSGRPLAALDLWAGGLHAGGAVIALALFAPPVLRWFGLPRGRFADALAPTAGVGVAIARLGCFLQGCCFGRVCRLPWCISFPATSYIYRFHASRGLLPPGASATLPIHPLQLYFAAAGLLVTGVALCLYRHRRYPGQVGLAALLVFSATSAALEPLRADYYPRPYWGPLPQLEWTALAMTAAAALALVVAERAHRAAPASQAP